MFKSRLRERSFIFDPPSEICSKCTVYEDYKTGTKNYILITEMYISKSVTQNWTKIKQKYSKTLG